MNYNYLKILYLFVFLSLISCGKQGDDNEKVFTYWSSNNSQEIEFARKMVDDWNKADNIYKIKHQPVPEGNSSEEVILASVVGETTPDIYSNMWQGDVEAYAQANVLVALDTLKGFLDFIYSRCDSSVIEEVRSPNGHIYQIPWKINPIMTIFNTNHIKDLGLTEAPRTYDAFLDACEKFKKDNDGDGYVDQWFGYSEVKVDWWQRFFDFYPFYLAASGGAPLVKDNKAAFNNEYAVNVFKFFRKLYENNYFSIERLSARQDVFLAGIIAIRFTGAWEISHADKYKPVGFEYNFSPIPVPDSSSNPVYTYCDPKNIVIFNSCEDAQSAWEFIKYTLTDVSELKLLELTNQLPRRNDLLSNETFREYFNNNPKMEIFAKQARTVRGTDQTPVLKEVFDLISQEYEACVVYGTKSAEQAIADAAKAVNLLYLD